MKRAMSSKSGGAQAKRRANAGKSVSAAALALCVALLFSSCGGSMGGGRASDSMSSSPQNNAMSEEMSDAGFDFDDAGLGETSYDISGGAGVFPADDSQKIIYTAYLEIETTSFEENRQNILDKLAACGGYVQSSSMSGGLNSDGTSRRRYMSLVLRVPAGRYAEFLQADGFGNVVHRSEDTEEVTEVYADIEARLASLEAQKSRLLELMDEAGSLEDLLAVEQRLSEVVYEIESYSSQKKLYDNRLSYCTVEISLNEVVRETERTDTFGGRVSAAFAGSWRSFVGFLQDAAVFLIYAAPAIVVLGVLAVVTAVLLKKRRAKRAAKAAAQSCLPGGPAEGGQL